MQPIEFLEYAKQHIEYSDKLFISKHSKLSVKKVYHLLGEGKGKKNALIISKSVLKLLENKAITDEVIENFRKKFAKKHLK